GKQLRPWNWTTNTLSLAPSLPPPTLRHRFWPVPRGGTCRPNTAEPAEAPGAPFTWLPDTVRDPSSPWPWMSSHAHRSRWSRQSRLEAAGAGTRYPPSRESALEIGTRLA